MPYYLNTIFRDFVKKLSRISAQKKIILQRGNNYSGGDIHPSTILKIQDKCGK